MPSGCLALGRRRTRRNKRRKSLRPRAEGVAVSDERREPFRCPSSNQAGLPAAMPSSAHVTIRSILNFGPPAARERAGFRRTECCVRHPQESISTSRPRAAFASLKELAQGAEPGGLVLGQFDLGVALCRQVQQMALMAEMCDHREWSKKNAEGLQSRKKAWPTLSTAGTRTAGRQRRCGLCPMGPATYWTWSAESSNVSARP
jgi:hypothetical protein